MARAKRFGAFSGVFVPSILTILGVIMFLRLPWIVGHAGLWATLGIILVAHIISASTGLSVASVATDKRVETGGSYYIISRSLGLPIGGTLGIALFVGLSFSVSLYLIGFAETFLSYFGFEVSLYTIRIAGSIILLLVAVVTFISTSLAIKTQYLIMTALVLSLLSVFLGSHGHVPSAPLMGTMDGALPWIALFAIFFPAVTGFEAGVSMSGDLKDPRKNIPMGTVMAILVGFVVYVGLAFFFAYTVDRDTLVNDPAVLFNISLVPQLVIAGILGATLSSALGSILGAPRILQAVAIDRILPEFFSKGHGVSSEPRNALIITYLIAQAGILIGELNVIARIVTIFFILTYGFLNITYAIESWAGSDFRPSFRIPRIVSIIGALACIVVMIQLDIIALLVASVVLIALFLFLKKRELTLQTGDTWTGVWSSLVKTGLARLSTSGKKLRNWRPNVMLFSGGEKSRPHLVEMGRAMVGKMGVFTNFELTEHPSGEILFGIKEMPLQEGTALEQKGVFTRRHSCRDIYEGIDLISRVYGFTGFEPNTILMGWAKNTRKPERFAALLNSLKKQDYNCAFLSYDKERRYGAYQQIDFWWKGHGRGLSLALFLLRFITSGNRWRTARIRILVINDDSSRTDNLYSLINQLLANNRMQAAVKVINNGVEQLPEEEIIAAESRHTDLSIMEVPEYGTKDMGRTIEKVNGLSASVGTALFILPSTFFDVVGVPGVASDTTEEEGEEIQRPGAEVFSQIRLSSREIIASEVYNTTQTSSRFLKKYYEQGLDRVLKLNMRFFPELGHFVGRTLDGLEKTVEEERPSELSKAFLRVLNDFSFHSQRQIQQMREHRVPAMENILEEANMQYLDTLRAMINVMPEFIRIKLSPRELAIRKEDPFTTRVYKLRKLMQAYITRKPVAHKIRLIPAAKYFLYHKRLESMHQAMRDFALYSLTEVVEVRKLMNGLHELIEKSRLESGSRQKMLERIKLERARMTARLQVLDNQAQEFIYASGNRLYESLLNDLQDFSDHLDKPDANILSRRFKQALKTDQSMREDLEGFAFAWSGNLAAFINKAVLDFYILSLKSRIHSKIKKYHGDFRASLEGGLIRQIEAYEQFAEALLSHSERPFGPVERLDHDQLKVLPVQGVYQGLYAEIAELLADIPDKIEISEEQLAEKMEENAFAGADRVVVSFRKTLDYYIGAELIDYSIKASHDATRELHQVVTTLKDQVRLLNFGLDSEGKVDAANEEAFRHEQSVKLARDFADKLRTEKGRLRKLLSTLESAFEQGLKKGFEPLSSATISKSSLVVRKRTREGDQALLSGKMQRTWDGAKEAMRRRFVDLLYSKSEGQLLISHYEGALMPAGQSNRELLSFAEAMTPSETVMKDLPFYYSSLFSGQSGISDDFWVGMRAELEECGRAAQRFKSGFPGALIITGSRSSGKSSLSKKVADHHFSKDNIHVLRAPQACSADTDQFAGRLAEAMNAHNKQLDDVFRALPSGKVVIIQDLGLWWERRPGGDAVMNRLQELIDHFGHKCLFILNVNTHALELIDRQTKLTQYALATVSCEPFDARELKDLIMRRHQAGGMKFRYNRRDEERMTAWDQARLFNRLFDLSFGNPGTATLLWLSSIKKVTGKTLVMDSVQLPDKKAFDLLSAEQWFYIQQFVINRRFDAGRLAANLERPRAEVQGHIRGLTRAGILIEKFEGIYAIRPGLDLFLVDHLKKRKRL